MIQSQAILQDPLKKDKWAIIGLGFIMPRHIAAIQAIGGEILLTCDIDASKNPDFTDWREMLKSEAWEEITHASILTPNYLHCEMAKEIIKQGKIVLCEKPIGLSSKEVNNLSENVFTVLQLRYHPEVIRLKNELEGKHSGKLIVKVKRDKSYWDGWKGQEEKSGGILFNLGIHYFDLLLYLFGEDYEIYRSAYMKNLAQGEINFNGTIVDYHLEIMSDDNGQDRYLEIDGEKISLSKQDNLSFEDLHSKVYEDLIRGRGVRPQEAVKSIQLCEKLKNR